MSQMTFNPDPVRHQDVRSVDARTTNGGVTIEASRPRQTEAPASPFREVLAGGVSVLMGGAEVATHVLGAPQLAAAISGASSRATTAISGVPSLSRDTTIGTSVTPSTSAVSAAASSAIAPAAAATASAAGVPLGTGSDASDLATMQAMQRESQVFNMQLLGLQDQVQQDSQRFSTLSNVMRAKHDTAKAAVSNIRS